MRIGFRRTKDGYKNFGEWEAQVEGLPQARCYGSSPQEAVGKLIFAFGKAHGIEFINPKDIQDQRHPKTN